LPTEAPALGLQRGSIWRSIFASKLRTRQFMQKHKIAERVVAPPAHWTDRSK
jgi:hypothetical protein